MNPTATDSDDNFYNIIVKNFEYNDNTMNMRNVGLVQKMAEFGLCFDIPIYLLNLWKSYVKDIINGLNQLEDISNIKENKNLSDQTSSALICLTDIESLFNYYLQNTIEYAKRPEKFKKSHDKDVDGIKFIPINLHIEKFYVNPTQKPSQTYDFTTCGAHSNVIVNDSAVVNTLLQTLSNPPVPSAQQTPLTSTTAHRDNVNFILLVFNTFKIFIQLADDLKYLNENSLLIDEQMFKERLEIIKNNIMTVSNNLLDSYLKYYKNDKFNFLQIKFTSFLVEINFIFTNKKFDFKLFQNFLNQISATIVEFIHLVTANFIQKFQFVDFCCLYSQSLTTVIAGVHLRFYNWYKNGFQNVDDKRLLEFYVENGLLVHYESLLSCISGESQRLYDHMNAIDFLNFVHLHVPSPNTKSKQCDLFLFHIDIEMDGLHFYLYTNNQMENQNVAIKLFPILMNVGVNEMAISSHLLGKDELQNYTIQQSYDKLKKYYSNVKSSLDQNTQKEIEMSLKEVSSIISANNRPFLEMTRPTELLNYSADISRKLNSIRITNCKSGKDRTGMSVSLEQCRLLAKYHNMPQTKFQQYLDEFRRFGTRNVNTFKNIGRNRYAFSKLRLYLLPQLYQPPYDTIDNVET